LFADILQRAAPREPVSGGEEDKAAPTNGPGQALPLVESTNVKAETAEGASAEKKEGTQQPFKSKKKRGPPENGVPSSTKIMVANLPYELSEEKVGTHICPLIMSITNTS
jgi:hypothetical protein